MSFISHLFFFFFFSSRRRHTRCYRDWSSDVCSSDLWTSAALGDQQAEVQRIALDPLCRGLGRSEERRVGKECRSRWSPEHYKKKKKDEEGGGSCSTHQDKSPVG